MVVDRARREEQPFRNRRVAKPVGEQPQHLQLPRGELRMVCPCARTRTARDVANAPLLKSPRDDRGRRPRSQPLQLVERLAQRFLLASVAERERRLVWAAELPP